jgi:hypothetical protein
MTLKLGATSIGKAYLGSTEVKKIYLGNSLVYSKTESLWTPSNLGSDLDLWLDAADSNTFLLDNSAVTQWSDKTQNNFNATQSVSTSRPVFTPNAINGKSAISFNGTSQFLNLPLAAARPAVYASFFVFKTATGGTLQKPIWCEEPNVGSDSKNYLANTRDVGIIYDQFIPSGGFIQTGSNTFVDSVVIVDTVQSAANSRSMLVNGSLIGSSTEQYAGAEISHVRIGARLGSSSYYHNSLIGEVISLSSIPSESDRKKIQGYLAWKWGLVDNLPSDHPYKNSAP